MLRKRVHGMVPFSTCHGALSGDNLPSADETRPQMPCRTGWVQHAAVAGYLLAAMWRGDMWQTDMWTARLRWPYGIIEINM
jgi:hypothetical protein